MEVAGACRCYREQGRHLVTPEGCPMSTLEFFDYLVSSEATHDLGLELADAWADQQMVHFENAA